MHAPRNALVAGAALLALVTGCSSDETAAAAAPSTATTATTATTGAAATTTASAAAPTSATVAPTTGSDAPATVAAASPSPTCGVDLGASAVTDAVARLHPAFDDRPDVAWEPTADGGNYDPCATLSAASVTVQGATGSSPEQVMMFHDGVYQGTGTRAAHGFTTIDVAASSDDTVVVDYRYPLAGESDAAASGRATVRYRWSAGAVHMLDTLPRAITG